MRHALDIDTFERTLNDALRRISTDYTIRIRSDEKHDVQANTLDGNIYPSTHRVVLTVPSADAVDIDAPEDAWAWEDLISAENDNVAFEVISVDEDQGNYIVTIYFCETEPYPDDANKASETLPISEKLYQKFEDSLSRLKIFSEWIEAEWTKNGRKGSFDNAFSNFPMAIDYIITLNRMIFDEAPMNADPAEAGQIMSALADFAHAFKQDDLKDGMEALNDAIADIAYVLDEYEPA